MLKVFVLKMCSIHDGPGAKGQDIIKCQAGAMCITHMRCLCHTKQKPTFNEDINLENLYKNVLPA
jgi:hypothetical protein